MSQKVISGLSSFWCLHGLPYVLLLKDVMTSGIMDGGNLFRSTGYGYYLQKVMQKTMNMDLQNNFVTWCRWIGLYSVNNREMLILAEAAVCS